MKNYPNYREVISLFVARTEKFIHTYFHCYLFVNYMSEFFMRIFQHILLSACICVHVNFKFKKMEFYTKFLLCFFFFNSKWIKRLRPQTCLFLTDIFKYINNPKMLYICFILQICSLWIIIIDYFSTIVLQIVLMYLYCYYIRWTIWNVFTFSVLLKLKVNVKRWRWLCCFK